MAAPFAAASATAMRCACSVAPLSALHSFSTLACKVQCGIPVAEETKTKLLEDPLRRGLCDGCNWGTIDGREA